MQPENTQEQDVSSRSWKEICKIQVERCYLLAGRSSPDITASEYLALEAANVWWANIPSHLLPKVVNEAIRASAPHMATIPYIAKFYEENRKKTDEEKQRTLFTDPKSPFI